METERQEKDEKKKFVSVAEYLEIIGSMGLFQILAISIFCLSLIVPSCQALILIFIGDTPSWTCSGIDNQCNSTKIYSDQSNCEMNRNAWSFTKPKSYSIVTEFDLACSKETLNHLSNSALFIGQLIGGLVTGFLSDRFGRKVACFTSLFALDLTAFLSSYAPDIISFILFRFVAGIFQCSAVVTLIVISVELVGEKYRAMAGIIIWNFWTISVCFMSLYSWLVPEWRSLLKIVSAPFIFVPILGLLKKVLHKTLTSEIRFVPESVRWYHSQNRLKEAENVLKRVAFVNNRTIPENIHLQEIQTKEVVKVSYIDLFSSLKIALKTLTYCVMWYTNDLLYFGITLVSSNVGGSLYRDFVLISLIETPAALFSIFAVNRFGRKPSVIVGYCVTFCTLFTFGILEATGTIVPFEVRITLGMLAKFFAILSWSSTEVWSAESYPTVIRAQSMALFYVMNQLGSASAPWFAQWIQKFHSSLPFFVIGGFAALSFIVCLWMPDTKGVEIQDYLEPQQNKKDLIITNTIETTPV